MPTVTGLGTSSGGSGGGTSVTITGTNFLDATAVTFGGVPELSYTINSATSITAIAPPNVAATDDVKVTNPLGTSSTSSADHFTYTAASAPTVTSLGTTSGYTNGGTAVTINGTNFTGASAVTFGALPALYFLVLSSTQIQAYAPVNTTTGTLDVTVTTPSGTSATSSSDHYTYSAIPVPTVTALSVSSGTSAGGISETITGTGFTNADDVFFGGVPADSFTINSDTSITATVPTQAAGVYDLTVTSDTGTSALGSGDRFTYTAAAAPAVTSLGTSSGTTAGGTTVIVNGSGFTGASDVFFGTVEATSFVVNTDSQITGVSPPEAAATDDITVVTPSGTSAVSSSDQFTVSNASAPSVSALSLTTGTTAGGAVVTISGSYFTGATGPLTLVLFLPMTLRFFRMGASSPQPPRRLQPRRMSPSPPTVEHHPPPVRTTSRSVTPPRPPLRPWT